MKREMRISILAIACVMCTATATSAFGAASVRTLGGAGTYTSASNASSGAGALASSGAIGAARAGSMRVTPGVGAASGGATASTVTGNTSTTAGRAASNPRLSIGKYLGGSTSISGGTTGGNTGGNTGSMDPDMMSDLRKDVDQLLGDVEGLKDTDDLINDTLDDTTGRVDVIEDAYLTKDDAAETYVTKDELENMDLGGGMPTMPLDNGDYILTIANGVPSWTAIEIVDK